MFSSGIQSYTHNMPCTDSEDRPLIDTIQEDVSTGHYNTLSDRHSQYYSSYVFDLTRSISPSHDGQKYDPLATPPAAKRNLGLLGGVFAAVALAQFSTNLFLRVGEWS